MIKLLASICFWFSLLILGSVFQPWTPAVLFVSHVCFRKRCNPFAAFWEVCLGDYREGVTPCLPFMRPASTIASGLIEIIRWLIDPDHFRLMPAPCRSRPTPRIELASLFVHDSALAADLHGLTAVTLLRRYELDTAVALLVVVPV